MSESLFLQVLATSSILTVIGLLVTETLRLERASRVFGGIGFVVVAVGLLYLLWGIWSSVPTF